MTITTATKPETPNSILDMIPGMRLPFHLMTKPRGAICNLDCEYCYFLAKEMLYKGSRFRMARDLLEEYIRQYIESQPPQEITFSWQGGEPTLMGLEFFETAVSLQQKHRPRRARIRNTIQTNGTTLNDDWCRFFKEQDFLVGVSIDGPRALHDVYRKDKGGRPTFDKVLRGIHQLRRHGISYNILTCVNAANVTEPLTVYRFLRDEVGAEHVQFIPIVERADEEGFQRGTALTDRSISGEQYGEFLITIFDEWRQQDVGKVFVQIFETALGAWLGQEPALCIFKKTCGRALAMEHNGDVYCCDHFVEPDYKLGNIRETPLIQLALSAKQQAFGQAKSDTLPRQCLDCDVRFVCNGGCPKNRILTTADGEPGLNYLCAGYKAFFTHVRQPMQEMARAVRRGQAATAAGCR